MAATIKRVEGIPSYFKAQGGWLDSHLYQGIARAGIPLGKAGYLFEDFYDLNRWYSPDGAACTPVTALVGGVVEIGIALVGERAYSLICGKSPGFNGATVVDASRGYYMALRFKTLTPGAPGDCGIRFKRSGAYPQYNMVLLGTAGMYNLTKYCATIRDDTGHGFIESTVDVDELWHDLEFWRTAEGVHYLSVDGETPVTGPANYPPTGFLRPEIYVSGNSPPTTTQYDKALWVYPQAE